AALTSERDVPKRIAPVVQRNAGDISKAA
ncbi:MAG: hypothetical protein RL481_33, partial [Pseudomonadota bacterium]